MIKNLEGDFENIDFTDGRSFVLYDNIETEDYPLHWHNAVEIILPLEKSFPVVCEGEEHMLSERDLFIIPAGTLHSLRVSGGRRLILLADNRCFNDNPALSELLRAFSESVHIRHEEDQELCEQLGSIITEIYTIHSSWKDMAEVYIYLKLITLFLRIREYKLGVSDEAYPEQFGALLKYIEQNYTAPITLDELAYKAGYSKYHFSRLFKKYCHTSFVNYLNRRRVKAAELMLVNEDISVTDAAMQSGFSSLTTFNRVFRDVKGCTPTEFRRLYRITNTGYGN